MPVSDRPRPRWAGSTQTPWIWQACGVAAPISALQRTLPSASMPALAEGALGGAADGLGGGADRGEAGAGVAERFHAAADVPAPHLAAEPPGVEAGDLDAGGDEGVGDRFTVQDREGRVELSRFEDL